MKIKQVKELDNGVSGITIEGKIIKTPKPPGDSEYGWSQMIILKDDTDEMGSWINIESAEDAYKVGQYIKVQGKVSKYMKGNKPGVSLNNGKVIEEIVKVEKTQAPTATESKQSNQTPKSSYEQKDDYWTKKFKYEVQRDPKVQLAIVRQTAIKAVVDLISSKVFIIKTKKDFYNSADEIVEYIFKGLDIMESAILGGETKESKEKEETKTGTKEERTKKAEGIVGDTQFKPATTKQKNFIYGYKGEDGIWKKGMIESRYIETHEIEEIGDPKKLSIDKASEWINFWLGESGNTEDIGERQKREFDNPRDSKGVPLNSLVKGNETSLAKDILVDEVNALRRKCRLNDDEKFKKEIGYSPKIESLTEKDLTKVKEILKGYAPF